MGRDGEVGVEDGPRRVTPNVRSGRHGECRANAAVLVARKGVRHVVGRRVEGVGVVGGRWRRLVGLMGRRE